MGGFPCSYDAMCRRGAKQASNSNQTCYESVIRKSTLDEPTRDEIGVFQAKRGNTTVLVKLLVEATDCHVVASMYHIYFLGYQISSACLSSTKQRSRAIECNVDLQSLGNMCNSETSYSSKSDREVKRTIRATSRCQISTSIFRIHFVSSKILGG